MSTKRVLTTACVLLILCLAVPPVGAEPKLYKIDPVHSQVSFTVRHIVSRVPGRFGSFSGEITVDKENPAGSKVTAEIEAGSIDTGNPKRDGHLKSPDFFEVEKFPKITFVSKSVASTGKDKSSVTGDLTMHGVTKPVTLDVTWLGFAGPKAGFEAKATLNRKDYGIIWNRVLDTGGAMLGDEVAITLLVEGSDAAAVPPPPPPAKAAEPPKPQGNK